MRKLIVFTALLTLIVTACAAGDDVSSSAPEAGDDQTLPTAPPGDGDEQPEDPQLEPGDNPPPTGGEGQDLPPSATRVDQLVEMATADLATRLGVNAELISVKTAEPVTWRDGSLGCPEPGMSYTQALVDGHRFELVVDGESYWYHQGGDADPRLCEDPKDPAPSPDV